ncbi:hypothetical protein [Roseimicrobium gellanilyticum]|uniref:hypothetical protein n=1 Tax=Roseimicrobium gellanilyticum TaxID=748857 RepID=UPI000DE918AC|nr:hypothetical protein [Roseimicrobium gellanilyticum]
MKETRAAFRQWLEGRRLSGCRLVQYCGPELTGAIDVEADAVEAGIEGVVAEGFYVNWAAHHDRLYLKIWEYGYHEPSWEDVYAERNMPKPWKRMSA